ncbi:MAG: Asd/ArgC dimerization domain-containing protein [Myxococcota bacterium]
MSRAPRIGLVGATSMLGREVAASLADQSVLQLGELRAFGSETSFCEDLEFGEDLIEVRIGPTDFSGLDLVVICTTPGIALDEVRQALRVEVPCIDCSGALLSSSEVPLRIADLSAEKAAPTAPLVTSPSGASLAWARVLSVLENEVGVMRVVGSVLHSASVQGHEGIEDLSSQTLALLSQAPVPESSAFAAPVAFDCFPHMGDSPGEGKDDVCPSEEGLMNSLRRLLGPDLKMAVTSVQVPIFAGEGSALCIETRHPVELEQAEQWFEARPGITVVADALKASTRSAVGREDVFVARLRRDASAEDPTRSLMLWLSADPLRLAAQNAAQLVQARFTAD